MFPSTKIHDEATWWIPISYSTPNKNADFKDTQPNHWIKSGEKTSSAEFDVKPEEWLLVNVQQTGNKKGNEIKSILITTCIFLL